MYVKQFCVNRFLMLPFGPRVSAQVLCFCGIGDVQKQKEMDDFHTEIEGQMIIMFTQL